jgi:hypothetical protein
MAGKPTKNINLTRPRAQIDIHETLDGAPVLNRRGRRAKEALERNGVEPTPHSLIEIMTTEQAAQFLGLAVPTLERRRIEGSGPPYAKLSPGPRGPVRYRREDLLAWVASKLIHSTSEAA